MHGFPSTLVTQCRDRPLQRRMRTTSAGEVNCGGIAAVDDYADTLAGGGDISARNQRSQCTRTTRLGDESQSRPEGCLSLSNVAVGDEHDALDVRLGYRQHQLADSTGRE